MSTGYLLNARHVRERAVAAHHKYTSIRARVHVCAGTKLPYAPPHIRTHHARMYRYQLSESSAWLSELLPGAGTAEWSGA